MSEKMEKTPKVTIVIPMYNTEKYLKKCLDSAIKQTLRDIEIICVDDGSNDNTRQIAEKYATVDSRIHLILSDVNHGPSYVRNRAIETAKGEYIQFLDSDDKIPKYSTEKLYNCAKLISCDAVVCNLKTTYEKQEYTKTFQENNHVLKVFDNRCFSGMELFKLFMETGIASASICSACLFCNRKFLLDNKIKFLEDVIYEDDLFSFHVLMLARKVSCLFEPCYYRLKREGSITTSPITYKAMKSRFLIYHAMVEWLKRNIVPETYRGYVMDHIAKYFAMTRRVILENVNDVKCDSCRFSLPYPNNMFDLFLFQSRGGYIRELTCEEIEKIRNSAKVVVYGAGNVARDAIIYLSYLGINQFTIAVTCAKNDEYLMGNRVYGIRNIEYDKKNTVVLIAVQGVARDEIFGNLISMGYHQIIKVTNH